MSPTLESALIAEEQETSAEAPPELYASAEQTIFCAARWSDADEHSLQNAPEAPAGSLSPSDRFSGVEADSPLPLATSTECTQDEKNSWPSEEPAPPSPGAILLEEFDALYQKYQRRVYRQCYRMLGNQEDAEDMAQEVFLQIFRKAHTFRGEANFSTWLHRLTVNTVLMQLRRLRRWRDSVTSMDTAAGSEEGSNDVLATVSVLAAPATSTLDRIGLDIAIEQLSSGYQEIFLLHDLEGYRHDEIARLLGISEGTSKSQLHKARLRLRNLIKAPAPSTSRTATGRMLCSARVRRSAGVVAMSQNPV